MLFNPLPFRPFSTVLLATLCAFTTAWAAESAETASQWVRGDYGQIRLIAANEGFDEANQAVIGVQIRLYKGWKTYWRSPGESGIPPDFDWSASDNLDEALVRWPTPIRISEFGSESFGYKQEVIFPVALTRRDPTQPVLVDLAMSFGVCRDICIPVDAHLSLDLGDADATPARTRHARHIDRFARMVPANNGEGEMFILSLRQLNGDSGSFIEVTLRGDEALSQPDAALELPNDYRLGAPRRKLSADGLTAILTIPVILDPAAPPLQGRDVSVVAWDGKDRAVEGTINVSP